MTMRYRSMLACLAALAACTVGPEVKDDLEPFWQLQKLARELDDAPSPEAAVDKQRQIGIVANRNMDLMIDQLRHGDTERKILAAMAMGFAPTKRQSLIPVLLAAMRDGGPEVRRMAAASCGRLQPEMDDPAKREQVRKAFRELLYDTDPSAREGALYGLSFMLKPGEHFDLLSDIHERLADGEGLVRNQAVIDLMLVRDAGSIGPLSDQIRREPMERVRANVCLALGAIDDEQANNILIDTLKDPDPDVVKFAHHALNTINRAELAGRNQELNRQHQVWREWWENVLEERLQSGGGK